jgi:hypothetical protein
MENDDDRTAPDVSLDRVWGEEFPRLTSEQFEELVRALWDVLQSDMNAPFESSSDNRLETVTRVRDDFVRKCLHIEFEAKKRMKQAFENLVCGLGVIVEKHGVTPRVACWAEDAPASDFVSLVRAIVLTAPDRFQKHYGVLQSTAETADWPSGDWRALNKAILRAVGQTHESPYAYLVGSRLFTDKDRARALAVLLAKAEARLGLGEGRALPLMSRIDRILKTALRSHVLAAEDYRRVYGIRRIFASPSTNPGNMK